MNRRNSPEPRSARRLAAAATVLLLAGLGALSSLALAEVTQSGNLRIFFKGKVSPQALPRLGKAPVAATLSGAIKTTNGERPPQLQTITLEINRNGRLDHKGLPRCNYHQIQPSTTEDALATCGRSLVGRGKFEADVVLPEQSPFPSDGTILAFNGNLHGKPVFYAHIYGTEPLPTSFVLPFRIERGKGTYGTRLVAELPRVAAEWGYVSGVSLKLERTFKYKGRTRSYLSAGCPAPPGFPGASFSFARAVFGFDDGRSLGSTLVRNCKVR